MLLWRPEARSASMMLRMKLDAGVLMYGFPEWFSQDFTRKGRTFSGKCAARTRFREIAPVIW
jgi:hypothetical protein